MVDYVSGSSSILILGCCPTDKTLEGGSIDITDKRVMERGSGKEGGGGGRDQANADNS